MSPTYLIIGILGKIKLSGLLAAICCSIWLTRNEVVFDTSWPKTLLQVLFRRTHWLRFWTHLQRSEIQKELILEACRKMENAAMHFFSLPTDGLLLLGLSFKSFLCCKHRRSYSGWSRNFFPLSKKTYRGHKLEGDPTVLKLTDSFFKDGTIFATSFIKQ